MIFRFQGREWGSSSGPKRHPLPSPNATKRLEKWAEMSFRQPVWWMSSSFQKYWMACGVLLFSIASTKSRKVL